MTWKRKTALVFFFIALLLFLGGCWNRRELNDLAIAVAMSVDKVGKQYHVAVQVVDPGEVATKKGGGGQRTPVTLYSANGETLFEAIRRITTSSSRKIYFSHLRMYVIGEALAREGIGNVLDFISRDHELRTDFYIVVAKNASGENALKILTPLEKIPAISMFTSLESSQKAWAPTVAITLDELINDIASDGKQPVLTGLEVTSDPQIGETKGNVQKIKSPAGLKYLGLTVFKEDKLIGWLNETESKAYNYIRNEVKSTINVMSCPKGGKLSIEIISSKTKVKGRVTNGKPQIDVEVRIEGNVGEVECKIDLTKTESIAELEKRAEQEKKDVIEKSIKKVQKKYKVDIFGFGEVIHRADPKAWKKLKKDWDKTFVNLPVNVKINVKIRRLGTLSNSFLEKIKK